MVEKTVVFQYTLPHSGKAIAKTIYSTNDDHCYASAKDTFAH